MGDLTFTDGMTFNTDGPYRATERSDGWYVCGGGALIPCGSEAEAVALVRELEGKQNGSD